MATGLTEVKEGLHVRVAIGENEDRPVRIATTLANAKVELKNAPTKVSRVYAISFHDNETLSLIMTDEVRLQ